MDYPEQDNNHNQRQQEIISKNYNKTPANNMPLQAHHHHHQLDHNHNHNHNQLQHHRHLYHSNCAAAAAGLHRNDPMNETNNAPLIEGVRFKLFMGEFLATFVFVYLGQAALTAYELIGTQNDTINRHMATIFTYGLAYLLATLLALNLSGAHLNPAYTFTRALFGWLAWQRALIYIAGQYLGSFLAAIFLHATYSDKLNQRHTEGLLTGMNVTLRAYGNILSTGKFFSSHPPTEVSLTQLIISYTLATAHLMFSMLIIHESKLIRIPRSMRPIYLAATLCLIMAAFSANGGPVLNPAQDFSPRLYIAMFGWGSSAFDLYNYKYWCLCGFVAPHVGAIFGFWIYQIMKYLHNIHDNDNDDHDVYDYNYDADSSNDKGIMPINSTTTTTSNGNNYMLNRENDDY